MRTLFTKDWLFGKFSLEASLEEIMEAVHTDSLQAHQKEAFKKVDVPHDWMIGQTEDLYENSIGCYKKYFTVPNPGKQYFITFEGVYMNSRIYLNGKEICFWPYGYSTFSINVTKDLLKGENELVVTCRYESPNTRWYSGAGIYRNVWLEEKEEAMLTFGGSYVSTKELEHDAFSMTVDSEALTVSETEEESLIRLTLKDREGNVVARSEKVFVISKEVRIITQEMEILNAHRWDIEDPYLYELTTELFVSGAQKDCLTEKVGFRTVQFDNNKGFFLNGRPMKINGACMHHDLGSLGAAVNKAALRRQFASLQKMGINSIRTSHNMPSVELMELADEMGMLINSESFDMWEGHKTDYDYAAFFKEFWEKDVESWVRRDRNHPSLIMWSVGNEIYDTHTENGLRIIKELAEKVRSLDPRHNGYTTIGSNYIAWENAQKCSDQVELSGYNYQEHLYEEHHEKYPHWCIYGSETSSTVQSRGIYHFPASNRLLTFDDLQCSSLDNCSTNWGAKNTRTVVTKDRDIPYSFGQYIWTGWDYIGEPTPYFTKNSYFGQVDTAGFEKDSYYIYQAGWTDYKKAPMVHITPYWDFNIGQLIDIQVYSNAPEVELFFNGESMGRRSIDQKHGEHLGAYWQKLYEPGELLAVAYDENGAVIAKDRQCSFKDAEKIVLTPDKQVLEAGGEDLIFLTITTVDCDGHYVANARNRVKVTVEGVGRLIGLDNGDSTDYDQYKGNSRKLFSGKLLAVIAGTKEVGEIKVTVESAGMEPEYILLQATEPVVMSECCASFENYESDYDLDEIPVRKIEISLEGANELTKENPSAIVHAKIYPENATYQDLSFHAMTLDGVDSNAVKLTLSEDGKSAMIEALGDDVYQICCFANNGKDHPEVMSVLEMKNTGLGQAFINPYELVCACYHSGCNKEPKLSFQGGVYTLEETTWLSFEKVDFGEYGSDEITLPIFSFDTCLPIEVWLGTPEDGELLLKDEYKSPSWYNHYQSNTFKLPRRIKGVQTISIQTHTRLSLNGFVFTKYEKAFSTIYAGENNMINGDSYIVSGDEILEIGNNSDLEFRHMDFGEKGTSAVVICGRSHNPNNTIHVRFEGENGAVNQIVEFPGSDTKQEIRFALEPVYGMQKVNFIFLPGSKFDFSYFRFE